MKKKGVEKSILFFWLPTEKKTAFKIACARRGTTMQKLFVDFVDEVIEKTEGDHA